MIFLIVIMFIIYTIVYCMWNDYVNDPIFRKRYGVGIDRCKILDSVFKLFRK